VSDPFDALLAADGPPPDPAAQALLPASIERYVLGEVERERARLRDLREKGLGSDNTLRAYRADWRVFTAWCQANRVAHLPAGPTDVARYVRYLFDRPRRTNTERYERGGKTVLRNVSEGPAHPKTIARHLLTVRKAHRLAGYDDPTVHRDVKLTVAGLRRERGIASKPKAAFDGDHLAAAVRALDQAAAHEALALSESVAQRPDDRHLQNAVAAHRLRVVRDRAILTLGWSGAMRRSEIVALDGGDLHFVSQGVEVCLRRSKTNQEGEVELLGIPYAPPSVSI
jgi:site-specific recombinase XerD